MKQWEEKYNFDWLPGYKEIIACQREEEKENIPGEALREPQADGQNGQETAQMLPPELLQREEMEYWEDYSYMLQLLPAAAREIWVVSDALLDRYEFEGSSIYAQYPDKNTVFKIADAIYEKLKYYETEPVENRVDGTEGKNIYYVSPEGGKENTPFRQLIFVVLCWNILYRRQRYYRRKKIFPLSY